MNYLESAENMMIFCAVITALFCVRQNWKGRAFSYLYKFAYMIVCACVRVRWAPINPNDKNNGDKKALYSNLELYVCI